MNAIIQQGKFTADGNAKTLKIRSDVDWIKIVNATQIAAANNGYGVEYYWQSGMGTSIVMNYHPAGDQTLACNVVASDIQIIDSSTYAIGANVAINAGGTDATRPVYSPASTAGLEAGNIVRINNTDHNDINGLDFSIDDIDNGGTNFRLANTLATAPGRIAGNNGYYRLVAPNIEIYRMFTPSNIFIANITQAASAVVTTLVDHGYAIGTRVKFSVPAVCGMTQLDGLTGNITAVTASTFTVDVDTTGFTAFKFPIYTDSPCTPAMVVPVGDNPSYTGYMTAPGKFYNQGFIGVVLKGGTTGPGGNTGDVVYWYAGKAERVDNE